MYHKKRKQISSVLFRILIQLFLYLINGYNCNLSNIYGAEPTNISCSFLDSVNITGAKRFDNGSYLHDNILYPKELVSTYNYEVIENYLLKETESHLRGCICKIKTCIRMCCERHEIMDEHCIYTTEFYSTDLPVRHKSGNVSLVDVYQNFGIVLGIYCEKSYYLEPEYYEEDTWELHENGSLLRIEGMREFNKNEYCLSPIKLENSTDIVINPIVCVPKIEKRITLKDIIYSYAMLFSVPFIIITIIIYLAIPELRNLHGKSLICYLAGLATGYSVLSFIRITGGETVNNIGCSILGFVIYFSFMSSFLWLSVISFDLWWNFRGTKGINRLNERKRFLLYCLYSYGISLTFLAFIIIMQNTNVPEIYKPGIGDHYCWLNVTLWIQIVYFYGPILLILIFNTTMFILTSLKIHCVQREMAKIIAREDSQTNLHSEKDKFGLFLRLFIIMGVTWTLEILSWLARHSAAFTAFFTLTDICNAIQGFVIFALFVLKRKVKYLILKRYNSLRGIHTQRTSTYSSKTNSSNITMTTMAIDRLITNEMNSKDYNKR